MVGMEASLLSAAVTGMLKILGNKLTPLVMKEYSSIVGVKKDLEELKDLAEEINYWLEDTVGREAMGGARSFNWLRKLKDVAYAVDDVVDEFQIQTEKLDIDGDSGTVLQCLCKKPKSFLLQCKVAHKIKAIKKRFAIIVKQRIDITAVVGHPVHHLNKTTVIMPTLTIVNEAAIFGRNQDKNKIITKLVKNYGQQEIEIVSVIGLGGTGKTTLAKLVFNDGDNIGKHFEARLWVHVSQEFNVTNIVENLFEEVTKEKSDHHTLSHMSDIISKKLTGKKVLLVLDDIWIEDRSQHHQFQENILVHLKSSASGSKILLTTRSKRVAEAMESTELYDLPFLSLDDSWQLFNRSFGGVKELGDEYQQVAKEIVGKCGGIPLAIKVLACTLRDKELIGEWKAIRDNSLLNVEGEESVSACLKLSYFYLPSHLKQCFTLCSLFPKGYLICKQQLIDLWIAHDMVSLTLGVDDLEHIGHRYFNSLVQVSFLEVEDEDFLDNEKRFPASFSLKRRRVRYKMHDLIHDLARSIWCDEIATILPEDATSSTKGYRYFSLIEPRNFLPKKVFQNARAIYVDKGNDIISGSTLKNAKRLCSIIIENSILSTPVLMAIFEVKNLKYLEMSELQCEALPEAITDVWSLQALYLESSNLLELPESIGKLKNLRTLNLSRCSKLKSLPDSIGDCQMLSTLDLICCGAFEDLPNSIGRNKSLRVLTLFSTEICRLPSSIATLDNLEYLRIMECYKLVGLPEGIGNLKKLKELDLDSFNGLPPGIGKLTQLEKLNMFCVETDKTYARISELATLSRISGKLSIDNLRRLTNQCEAHQACLKQKERLHELELSWGHLDDDRENPEHEVVALDGLEPPLGIKQLDIWDYGGGRFASWMLKQASGGVQGHGQFPFLTKMSLIDFPNLKHLDGLVQLPCLEELDVVYMPALESISGGPFPSLAKVKLEGLDSLGEVWIGKEGEGCSNHNLHKSGKLQIGNCLTDLHIRFCPKLVVKPHFPISLEHLQLHESSNILLLSPFQSQGSSSFSNSPPSFSHLKVLEVTCMEASLPLSQPASHGLRLELLQHMSALESLEISGCSDLIELPEYLGNVCSLQRMTIENCDRLSGLPQSIGRLTSLQELIVTECHAIVQFPESLGELCSLRRFMIYDLPELTCLPKSLCHLTSLKELSIGNCESFFQFPEGLGELRSLRSFDISSLPVLTCLPKSLFHLMSLKELSIGNCEWLVQFPEGLGELRALSRLVIDDLPVLACLPKSLFHLTSLKELIIMDCIALVQLPEGLGELCSLSKLDILCLPRLNCLPQSLCRLMSLQELRIGGCHSLGELPECLGELHRLRKLEIWRLEGMTCLPQSLSCLTTSLKELRIRYCPGLTSLPEWIKGLTALQLLEINGYPDLERRCESGTGEDWHLISHIPNLQIGRPR